MTKHIHHYEWYWFNESVWNVNAKASGLYTHILRPLLRLYEAILNTHSKVFVYRFDIRVSQYSEDNTIISGLIRRLKKRIKTHYGLKKVTYFWIREQERSKNQHYHVLLMLDGQKVRHPYQINQWINHYSELFDLSPHFAGYHNVRRDRDNYEIVKEAACYHISYLAKVRGKGHRPDQTKDFSHSRFIKQ